MIGLATEHRGGRGSGLKCSQHKAFTLVELLVVVAIIALLVTIVAPTIRVSQQLAVGKACLANQRLMVNALQAYQADYGTFPYNYGSSWIFERWWGGTNAYSPYTNGDERWALGYISPYLPGGEAGVTNLRNLDEDEIPPVYICPGADLDIIYSYNPSDKYHACYWSSIALRANRGWGAAV